MNIQVRDLVGEYAITLDQGQKVYDLIHPELLAEHCVALDFAGVNIFASPFFNAAIGHLLKDIEPDSLKRSLVTVNLNDVGQVVLLRIIANATRYYADPTYRKAVDDVLREQAEAM